MEKSIEKALELCRQGIAYREELEKNDNLSDYGFGYRDALIGVLRVLPFTERRFGQDRRKERQ